MKTKPYIRILLISACLIFLAISSAQSEFECVEGTQTSGSLYRICTPVGVPGGGPQKLDNVISSESDPDRRI